MYESAQMLLNRVMIGNLGEDPEIRHTPSGLPLMKFSLATDESYLDREGKPQERVLRHIVAAGKLALVCHEYLQKADRFSRKASYAHESGEKERRGDAPRSSPAGYSSWVRLRTTQNRTTLQRKPALSPSRIFHSKHDQRGRAQTRPR